MFCALMNRSCYKVHTGESGEGFLSMFRVIATGVLALASTAFAVAQPAPKADVHTIDVQSFSFAPSPIHLAAGTPVTLVFVNHSGSGHDFTAPQFFAAATFVAGSAPKGEIDLPPHETRTVTLIPRAGAYKAHCSHFMHAAIGMHDEIVVH